jgi:LysM repeat protein
LASNAPINYTPNVPVGTPSTPGISQFIVPVVTSTPDESGLVYHEVQSGQSLWAIAIAYETKIDEIRRLNNLLADALIYPGDRLIVRKEAVPTSVEDAATTLPTIRPTESKTPKLPLLPTSTEETIQTPTQVQHGSDRSRSTGIIVGIVLVAILITGMLTWLLSNKPGRGP